jgi:hypothetical protein
LPLFQGFAPFGLDDGVHERPFILGKELHGPARLPRRTPGRRRTAW